LFKLWGETDSKKIVTAFLLSLQVLRRRVSYREIFSFDKWFFWGTGREHTLWQVINQKKG